jgi:hypothetical protein
MTRIVKSRAFALLACSILLVASNGCTPGTPTDPSSAPQNVVVSPDFVRILSTSQRSVEGPRQASSPSLEMISAQNGGVVTNGHVTLEFPPFALGEDTEISIEMLDDEAVIFELGPHGLQFNRPVTMIVDLHGTSAEDLSDISTTLWYNEEKDWWERIDAVDMTDPNLVAGSLLHFSRYAATING